MSGRLEKIRKKIINPEEKIIAHFGIAKVYSNFWIFLGVVIFFLSFIFLKDFFIVILLAIFLIGYGFYLKVAYHYFLTDKKVVFYYQFFSSYSTSVDYQKITDLNIRESFFEKIFFQSGSLAINTAGGPKEEIVFGHLTNPYSVKKKIDEIKVGN